MDLLFDFSRDGTAIPTKMSQAFGKIRHSIGRLAQRIRAIKEVVEDAHHLEDQNLLDVFEVALVPRYRPVERPQVDAHVNLSNVLTRMLRANETERHSRLLHLLAMLNDHTGLEQELRDRFDPKKPSPSVHAEVQMLHHFYENKRSFFAGDTYIATSKPACFCCKLYFRHHPAGHTEPDSHEKVYPNWGLTRLSKGVSDSGWPEQRALMTAVVGDLCKEVIREIERRRAAPLYGEHQDTLTALTASSHTLGDESSVSEDEGEDQQLGIVSDFGSEADSDGDSDGGVHI